VPGLGSFAPLMLPAFGVNQRRRISVRKTKRPRIEAYTCRGGLVRCDGTC